VYVQLPRHRNRKIEYFAFILFALRCDAYGGNADIDQNSFAEECEVGSACPA
jgi:hypothetical protein